jgi:maltose alpha-D-glucosyltransferase/alpha-amylase
MISGADAANIEQQHGNAVLSRITGARKGLLFDGLFDDGLCALLLEAMQEGREIPLRGGRLVARGGTVADVDVEADGGAAIRRSAPDQSNTSVLFGWQMIFKTFRRIEAGPNPDVEIGEFLRDHGFTRVPPLLGTISYVAEGGAAASVGMLQRFVANQGNAWDVTIEELGRYFDRVTALPQPTGGGDAGGVLAAAMAELPPAASEAIGPYLSTADVLGRRTGELHVVLASDASNPSFAPEAYSPADFQRTAAAMRADAEEQLKLLESMVPRLDDRRQQLASEVLAQRAALLARFDALQNLHGGIQRIRCHGDYHLGQVLVAEGDVVILDFEGEPARSLEQRRARCTPLRDVAGMLRSFSYAALTGLGAATQTRPEDAERLAPWADLWERWVSAAFLRAYLDAARAGTFLPTHDEDLDVLLQAFVLDKAMYELGYELNNRPDWVHMPLTGLLRLGTRPAFLLHSSPSTH